MDDLLRRLLSPAALSHMLTTWTTFKCAVEKYVGWGLLIGCDASLPSRATDLKKVVQDLETAGDKGNNGNLEKVLAIALEKVLLLVDDAKARSDATKAYKLLAKEYTPYAAALLAQLIVCCAIHLSGFENPAEPLCLSSLTWVLGEAGLAFVFRHYTCGYKPDDEAVKAFAMGTMLSAMVHAAIIFAYRGRFRSDKLRAFAATLSGYQARLGRVEDGHHILKAELDTAVQDLRGQMNDLRETLRHVAAAEAMPTPTKRPARAAQRQAH